MLAVVEQGGKQHLIKKNQVLKIEKIDAEVGSEINIPPKLTVDSSGVPFYGKGSVMAEVISQERGEKLIIFKRRRRKNSRRKNGHRQYITVLRIKDIIL